MQVDAMKIQISHIFFLALILVYFPDVSSIPTQGQISLTNTSLSTLQFVAIMSRHGSRSPLKTYPNDPYPFNNRLYWPSGPQEITFQGKQQLFLTGEKLRRRYAGFLPDQFYPNETLVEYNDFNRDFSSAALLLAGLYPPVGTEIWNRNLIWQPIPIYINHFDVCLLNFGNQCPYYRDESNGLVVKMDREGYSNNTVRDLLRNVSLHTGLNITRISTLYFIYDTLTMQQENGLRLPLWAQDYYPQPLRSICTPVLITTFAGSDNIIRLSSGPELKQISNILNMKANRTYDNNRKMFVEVSHDCNLVSMLRALGNTDPLLEVRTSAYLTFELHFISQTYIVKVLYYRNSSVDDAEIINITGCPTPCSLENFTRFVDRVNPPNWKEMCNSKRSDSWYKRT